MAYDDAEYLDAINALDGAVAMLVDNDISPVDIHEAVDAALENLGAK